MLQMLTVAQLVKILLIFRSVRKTAKRDYWLRHVCPYFQLSAWNISAPIEWIFIKFAISKFIEKICREKRSAIEIWHSLRTGTNWYLSQFLEWEMFQRNFVEKINTHILMFNNFFPLKHAVHDIAWEKYGTTRQVTDDNIIRHMHFPCWINKATNAYSEYLILSLFHSNNGYAKTSHCYVYTYIVCLILSVFCSSPRFLWSVLILSFLLSLYFLLDSSVRLAHLFSLSEQCCEV